jgi:hypothetical protein
MGRISQTVQIGQYTHKGESPRDAARFGSLERRRSQFGLAVVRTLCVPRVSIPRTGPATVIAVMVVMPAIPVMMTPPSCLSGARRGEGQHSGEYRGRTQKSHCRLRFRIVGADQSVDHRLHSQKDQGDPQPPLRAAPQAGARLFQDEGPGLAFAFVDGAETHEAARTSPRPVRQSADCNHNAAMPSLFRCSAHGAGSFPEPAQRGWRLAAGYA